MKENVQVIINDKTSIKTLYIILYFIITLECKHYTINFTFETEG